MLSVAVWIGLWMLGIGSVYAAESVENDPVVVTAKRLTSEELIVTDTITREDIEQSGQRDITDVLQYELGVPVISSGGSGQSSSIFLRGVESRHTLMLIDGVALSSATTGLMAIEHFPSFLFDQIDVTRGNVSAIYGSGALGGVINMTTRSGHGKPTISGQMGLGSEGRYQANVNYSGQIDNTSFFLGGNLQGLHGRSAMVTGTAGIPNPDDDGYHNQAVLGSISHRFDRGDEIGLHVFHVHANTRYDNVYGPIEDDQVLKSDNRAMIFFWKTPITNRWRSHFSVAETVDKARDYNNGLLTSTFETRNRQIFWRHEWQASDTNRFTGGVEWQQQRVSSSTDYDRNKRNIGSIYGGYEGQFDQNLFRLNLRYDHYSDVGSALTYLLGYGYQITPDWQVSATIGNAFSAPTFNHLYFPNFGNPDLKPEKSQNQELSIRYTGDKAAFRTTLFHTRVHDLIGGYPLRNFAKADIKGIEFDGSYDLKPFVLKTKLTLQDPEDKETGELLNRRSRQYGMVRADYYANQWGAGVEWLGVGRRIDNGARLGGYSVWNLSARYQPHRDWTISAFIDNFTDKRYLALDGYAAPQRTFWMQVTYQPQ